MGKKRKPKAVKLIISVFSSDHKLIDITKKELENIFGPIDLESNIQNFDFTDYYNKEMGDDLKQKLFSFSNLIDPELLSCIKIRTNQLEKSLSSVGEKNDQENNDRRINIDPGYVSLSKFILASTKDGPARIYLNQGIYAEITLGFVKKSFQPVQWTYQNYQTNLFVTFLNQVRNLYKTQTKNNK